MYWRAVAGGPNPRTARPDDRQAPRQVPTEETIVEMTWMETFQLLGLDLLALMLMALVVLDVVEHAMRSAWVTVRSRKSSPPKAAAALCGSFGGVKHI
jgi:hypothetical protein